MSVTYNNHNYSCFGLVNDKLYLGVGHHMAIMQYLLGPGEMDWETLMNARQTWGWILSAPNDEKVIYRLSTDAAAVDETLIPLVDRGLSLVTGKPADVVRVMKPTNTEYGPRFEQTYGERPWDANSATSTYILICDVQTGEIKEENAKQYSATPPLEDQLSKVARFPFFSGQGEGKAFWYEPETGSLHWGDTHYLIAHSLMGGFTDDINTHRGLEEGVYGWIFPSDEQKTPDDYMIDFGSDFGMGANKANPHLQRAAVEAVENDIGYPAEQVFYSKQSKTAAIFLDGGHGFTCFGFLDNKLFLGARHHMAIMKQMLAHGYTWDQLVSTPQLWGWVSQYRAGARGVNEPAQILLRFSTDAASLDPSLVPQVREAFARLTGESTINVIGMDQSNEEYAPEMDTHYGPGGIWTNDKLPEVLVYDFSTDEKIYWSGYQSNPGLAPGVTAAWLEDEDLYALA